MKLLIVIALFALAAAEPEADSQFFYNAYNAYSPYYYNYGVAPYTYGAYSAYNYPYVAYNRLFKREAEAEADPQFVHPYAFNYPYAYQPYTYTHPVVTKVEYKAPEMKEMEMKDMKVAMPATYAYTHPVATYPYAYHPYTAPVAHVSAQVIPRYHAKSAGGVEHTVLKRSADSEADPFYFYNGYYNAYPTYAYTHPYRAYSAYSAYHYGYPYVY